MRFRKTSGVAIFILSVAIASLNLIALKYYLYWRTWWYDIPMHFLGGLVVTMIALWFVAYEVPIGVRPRVNRLVVALVAAFVIGILWEVFEYAAGISYQEAGYWSDTLSDIAMDVAGGLAAYLTLKNHGR